MADLIDDNSPVPPYRQVAAELVRRIESGEITSRLPSIVDITQEFEVARQTAAKALRVVAEDGHAELSPGMGYYAKRR